MFFAGILKLTLLDYPDKTACTLFTAGCDFNCPFCQNSSLIYPAESEKTIDATEVLDFLKTRQGLLDGVCISGGEPLMHEGLADFVREVKSLGFLVKLDTNGSYPKVLKMLVESGAIDYIAMDIKNTPQKYAQTIGVTEYSISPIEESIAFLLSDTVPYEFRTTVVREFHTCDDLLTIAQWIPGARKYVLQGFVDSDGVIQRGLSGYNKQEMEQFLGELKQTLHIVELRGY